MSQRSDDPGGRPSWVGDHGGGSLADDRRGGSFLDDLLSSVFAVLGIGILLFAVSGVWPPMVAIESGSMEPHINTGDLVFVMEEERFAGAADHNGTGVVTAQRGATAGYEKFEQPGDVIVFAPDGDDDATPIIHRAMLWVNESENWYEKANPNHLPEDAESCNDIVHCPAPNDGFITKGDNKRTNDEYDQARSGVSKPVEPEWVVGTAEFRMQGLGFLRLRAAGSPTPDVDAAALALG